MHFFLWMADSKPSQARNSREHCWICIRDHPQEYGRPLILFAIARGIGAPLSLDPATTNQTYAHFARI
ncbi:hypothetical protein Fmac_009330 [Flemingia macrophylla]|uniref:Uncharacterized protein n=1 Tax=Flemingia macrophylla TaxID=520843 RepID=A0ABD1N2G7_9FABA